jgi:hypothetical protein
MLCRGCLDAHPAPGSCLRLYTSREAFFFSVNVKSITRLGERCKGPTRFLRKRRSSRCCPGETQKRRIWQGNDGEQRASYLITACTVKFLGGRDRGEPPIGEPPPEGYENSDLLPF